MSATSPRVLRFKRYATVTHVAGDAVYLTSERGGRIRLHGRGVQLLAPYLDGTHDRDSMRRVAPGSAPDQAVDAGTVDTILDLLLSSGHVVEADPRTDVRAAGYWELAGFDGDATVERLAASTVAVLAIGDVDATPTTAALASAGVRADQISIDDFGRGDLTLVLTDDYRRPELAALNERALREAASWMLAKPLGSVVWIGPTFVPGAGGACYECLRVRLAGKSMTESYLRQREAITDAFVESTADLPATRAAAATLTALQVVRWLSGLTSVAPAEAEPFDGVTTLDTFTLVHERHELTARPQCRRCGDPGRQAARSGSQVVLQPRPKANTSDGGHRAMTPEAFVAAYSRFVSPLTGPVSHLQKMPLDMAGIHTYTAGQNFAVPMRTVADLRAGLRSASCGKGISDIQAKASALGEAIERYSCVFHGDEPREVHALADLDPDDVLAPNDVHLFSDQQFTDRADWNARPSHFHWVGEPLDPQRRIEWSPVWSMTRQRHLLTPTSMLYFSYHSPEHPFQAGANSNGCAAGSSLEDAILQGFFELVERDATAMWWYNRVPRRAVDLSSFDHPYFAHWQQTYDAIGRDTWVLDITNDLGIPTVVAVSRRRDHPVEDILFALGSHFDVEVALGRALSEMNQFLPAVVARHSDGSTRYAFDDPAQLDWWQHARLADHPYLAPTGTPATAADFVDLSSDDLADDVRTAQRLVEARGLEFCVLDSTRVDIGLPVARVIVPGMRHFWPRYAPGRLFDVPVSEGWVDRALTEDELNPVAMFL